MKKRLLAVFVSLCMVFSMMPATAFATNSSSGTVRAPGEVSTWAELEQAIVDRSDATLVKDIECPDDGSALTIPGSKTFTLDLNGYTLDRKLGEAADNGSVILNKGFLTIKDSSPRQTGKITGGNTTGNGGGIYCDSGSSLTLEKGVSVCGNFAVDGGGIYGDSYSAVKLQGAVVCHNTASGSGGGICTAGNSSLEVSGEVSNNAAVNGGGIRAAYDVRLSNAVISDNIASGNGGGLCMSFSIINFGVLLRMEPGEGQSVEITGNKAASGGGIYIKEVIGPDGSKLTFRVTNKVVIEGNADLTGSADSNTYLSPGVRMRTSGSGLAADASIHVASADSTFFCDYNGNPISLPPQVVFDGSSSASADPFPVVYFGTDVTGGSDPIAWYLLPATNYSGGNAWFLWSKDSVGSKKFASVDKTV